MSINKATPCDWDRLTKASPALVAPIDTHYINTENKTVERNTLGTDATERKSMPLYKGCLTYFPKALAAVAECSMIGANQHGQTRESMHWDRSKSGSELDALMRHLVDAGFTDSDGIRHSAKVAWRALANLELELEIEDSDTKSR